MWGTATSTRSGSGPERCAPSRGQLQAIADELGVAKGSVSVWVRDVPFTPRPGNRGHAGVRPHPLHLAKLAELGRCQEEAEEWVASMTHRELTAFCLGLYAGEGSKTPGEVSMANTNPRLLVAFLTWIRCEFEIDETRLRVVLYLHEDLDLEAASAFWSRVLRIPISQFTAPYRAVADPTRRKAKHIHGCATVRYASTLLFRRVMARIEAVTSVIDNPG